MEGITTRAQGLRADLARPGIEAPDRPRADLTERVEEFLALPARAQLGTPPAIA
ncbi:hypothetical protein [Kitasatospora sp. NPDC059327]|uniref:hypothetical protein n=1 Tax=Kitasatospora sp. NPDC059327 TaxID=3346803 RepID=UPI0036B704D9